MWKLKRKVCPKHTDKPSAKINKKGEFVTDKEKLKELYVETYKERLRHRDVHAGYETMYSLKMYLFGIRYEVSREVKSSDWTDDELSKVLKSLKCNKSGDHFGLIYEIFKPDIINQDMFSSLLLLCNKVKSQLLIPKFIEYTDITSIYKNKGSRFDLENDRGIFGVGKVRSIMEKLLYNDIYEPVDDNMSDSNVGARKNRNIRDNLFVLYAVRNGAIQRNICLDLHFMDLSKCFDSMWAEETMNDLFDLGVQDDRFALISNLNNKCRVSVKTPVGQTEEFCLENIEMQGTVSAPLKCTGQIDSLGRIGYTNQTALYKYNQNCYIPILGMIDDTLGMSACGMDSVELNAFVNTTMESKKLYFNVTKCHKIHVGPRKEECPTLKVHNSTMKESDKEKYLGDMVSGSGNEENIKFRRKIGFQTISEQMAMLKEVAAGGYFVGIGLVFRDSVLLPKLLLNSDVWHALTLKHVESLEELDKIFLRNILSAHSKVGIECLFLDTGKMPLRFHIIQRRQLYLWHILHTKQTELIVRVFESQKLSPRRGDWVKLVDEDHKKMELGLSHDEISKMSKSKFKAIIEVKVKTLAMAELNKLKAKHSKSEKFQSVKFQTANYLTDYRLSRKQQQLLFRLRSRTLNVKMNFSNQHENLLCSTCKLFPETQAHLLQCPQIVKNMKTVVMDHSKLSEEDIYGSLENQIQITHIYEEILEIRDKLIEEDSSFQS